MDSASAFPPDLVSIYSAASVLLLGLVMEALLGFRKKTWAIPALLVYLTVGIWYFTELIYTPENFADFPVKILESCFHQVIFFLVGFRLFLPSLTQRFLKNYHLVWRFTSFNPETILLWLAALWFCLLLFGISRMNGDVLNSLFPLYSRNGPNMWGRSAGAAAGSSGFIVSSASYIYLMATAFFGILLPLPMRQHFKLLNILLFAIAVPYYFFMGARNQFLAVLMPFYLSYILFSNDKWWKKAIFTVVSFWAIDHLLSLVIIYRSVGFQALFDPSIQLPDYVGTEEKHLGLNMLEELCYINQFYEEGVLQLSFGGRYLAELANIVPRAIWPNKPLIGIDYAILRGFADSSSDIGVSATIATGLIGQGFVNFGPFFGPVAASVLMATWAAFMSRLWAQQFSTLRLGLFLICLGLTFNMGREITLLVIWPALFGYVMVRVMEKLAKQQVFPESDFYTYYDEGS